MNRYIELALLAYQEAHQARLQADRADRALLAAVAQVGEQCTAAEREGYYRLTEQIRERFNDVRRREGLEEV